MSQNKDIRIQQKADLRNEWENNNPVLLDQEIGFERNTGKFKMGDGLTPWNDLPYYLNIENGEQNSIVLNSVENISGEMYVFFIKSIDMTNKKIYLCNEHQNLPEVSTNDYTDTTFSIEEYSVGDTFDLIVSATAYNKGRSHAHFVGTIENIEYNVITYAETLPFNDLLRDTAAYSHSFFVSSKPRAGVYNISGYATAEGNYTIAAGPWSHAEGYGTLAAGRFAHAEGYDTRAGYGAHAEGQSTTAKGINSHAEGYATQANNNYAHAEGRETIANGHYGAHAEGYKSEAIGNYSHAEGSLNKAAGIGSHAEGYQTQAIQQTAHAEGYGSIASGIAAHAEGYNTQARGARAHTEGHHTYAFGDYAHSEGHSTKRITSDIYDENGNILPNDKIIETYNTSNFSLAKGIASHTEGSNNLALGDYSHAEGQVNIISSNLGHVEGYGNKVLGEDGHAEGRQNTASGSHSHAEGYQSTASGSTSHSEGHETTASGIYSHVEGLGSSATSNSSHAEGYQTTSKAQGSHSEGISTTASAAGAHAEGSGTTASGNYAHAEGNSSTATAQSAHSEGQTCHATGQYGSHAEGFSAQARGQAAHAENRATQAIGNFSHSEGEYSVANGLGSHTEGRSTQTASGADYSHAEGEYTVARGKSQHVQGKYNVLDYNNTYAHIVGNGKAAEKDANGTVINPEVRSNAHTVDWEGNGWFAGNVSVGIDGDKLATENYVNEKINSQTNENSDNVYYYGNKNATVNCYYDFELDNTQIGIGALTNSNILYFPKLKNLETTTIEKIVCSGGVNDSRHITIIVFPREVYNTVDLPQNIQNSLNSSFSNLQYIFYMNPFGQMVRYTL